MSIPSFVPYPPGQIQRIMLSEEWQACLDSWIILAHGLLSLDRKAFAQASSKNQSLSEFLVSYASEASKDRGLVASTRAENILRRDCFLLIHRLFTEVQPPLSTLLRWEFLGDLSTVYARTASLKPLIDSLWRKTKLESSADMLQSKKDLLGLLDAAGHTNSSELNTHLQRVAALLKSSHCYGNFLMVGSDIPDSIAKAWSHHTGDVKKKLVAITYLGLSSLLEGDKLNASLLIDHLFSLKTITENQHASGQSASLLSQLVSTTHFLRKLQDRLPATDSGRAKSLISYLEGLKATGMKPKTHVRRRIDKGKHKERDEYGHGAMGGVHVHKMSLITQIQDLFPHLGSGFIVKLLDEYNDNTEQVTAHLLDDSLPECLKDADRSEQLYGTFYMACNALPLIIPSGHNEHKTDTELIASLAPHSTPPLPPTRRNVFDNDDFDNLAIDASRLHIGRKNPHLTADALLSDRSTAPNKAAILSALAAFDSDDDERDDTYDAEDVGGTVDSAMPGSEEVHADLQDKNEEPLFAAYKMSPGVFERDANTRRGKARIALRSETGMTDEAIEGWAIMLGRDPRGLRRLEAKFSMFAGGQRELASTAYRESGTESGTEGDDTGGERGGRGGFRGRARGRGRGRGRGGDVAGPADERATQVARQRKDASKGSRANHNRRDQRARKVARAGFPG
ncbi:hypothetical protein MMC32_001518 [Xylographa parallela]|nr:hypothetical protein [Xylographa parallela]